MDLLKQETGFYLTPRILLLITKNTKMQFIPSLMTEHDLVKSLYCSISIHAEWDGHLWQVPWKTESTMEKKNLFTAASSGSHWVKKIPSHSDSHSQLQLRGLCPQSRCPLLSTKSGWHDYPSPGKTESSLYLRRDIKLEKGKCRKD